MNVMRLLPVEDLPVEELPVVVIELPIASVEQAKAALLQLEVASALGQRILDATTGDVSERLRAVCATMMAAATLISDLVG